MVSMSDSSENRYDASDVGDSSAGDEDAWTSYYSSYVAAACDEASGDTISAESYISDGADGDAECSGTSDGDNVASIYDSYGSGDSSVDSGAVGRDGIDGSNSSSGSDWSGSGSYSGDGGADGSADVVMDG